MTVPKELNIPESTDFLYNMDHFEELCARELVEHMSGRPMEVQQEGTMKLPHDSLSPGTELNVAPYINLSAGNHELSGLVGNQFSRLEQLALLYEQFDMNVSYLAGQRRLDITVAGEKVSISTEQTDFDNSITAYLHMARGIFACFSGEDADIVSQIHDRGVLISTLSSGTETALAIPGSLLNKQLPTRVSLYGEFQHDVLYPIDVFFRRYETFDKNGEPEIRQDVNRMLSVIHPVGVRIMNDSSISVHIKKQEFT